MPQPARRLRRGPKQDRAACGLRRSCYWRPANSTTSPRPGPALFGHELKTAFPFTPQVQDGGGGGSTTVAAEAAQATAAAAAAAPDGPAGVAAAADAADPGPSQIRPL
jgi:hypothetical protein